MQKRSQQRALTPWRPFREVEEMEHGFEDLFSRFPFPLWRRTPLIEGEELTLAVDVFEKDDKFIIKAELLGMKQDDIDVSVTDKSLTIRGEKKTESEVKEKNYLRSERSYGSFYRSIPLPANIDSGRIQASYEDGVLEISLPKTAASKAKKIKIVSRK